MKSQNLLIVTGSVLVIAVAVFLLLKRIRAGADSPITVADGSIEFKRDTTKKKQFHKKSDTEYWVEDPGFQATGVLCDSKCSTVCSSSTSLCSNGVYPLCDAKANCKANWKLTLDDGTEIYQDGQHSNRFIIKTSAKADSQTGDDPENPETFKMNSPRLKKATLTLGDDNTALQTLTCQAKCQISIHYYAPK